MASRLLRIDQMNASPSFQFDRAYIFRSLCGGVSTIVLASMFTLLFFSTLYRYAIVRTPEIHQDAQTLDISPVLDLTTKGFPMVLSLVMDDGSFLLDESLLQVRMNIIYQTTSNATGQMVTTRVATPIPLISCSKSTLRHRNLFMFIDLNQSYCIDVNSLKVPAKIWTKSDRSEVSTIQVSVSQCFNGTCASQAAIDNAIKLGYLQVTYLDTSVQGEYGYKVNRQRRQNQFKVALVGKFKKLAKMSISPMSLITDSSLLSFWTSITSIDYFQLDYYAIDITPQTSDYDALVDLRTWVNTNLLTTRRSFTRLDEFLAEIGGYLQILAFLACVLINPILRRLFTVEASKKLLKKQQFLSNFMKKDLRGLELLSEVSFFKVLREQKENRQEAEGAFRM